MKIKNGQKVYGVWYPITAFKRLVQITSPNSRSICFGIHTVIEIETEDGPGMLVKGTDVATEWADPKYTEFLVDVGQIEPERGVGLACFLWRDSYWVRAVRSDRKAAQKYMKYRYNSDDWREGRQISSGGIVQYILLPVSLSPNK